MPDSGLYVSLPLSQLNELLESASLVPVLSENVKMLSNRLDGCYSLLSECMLKIGDLSRR